MEKQSHELAASACFALAAIAAIMSFYAPIRPDALFLGSCVGIVALLLIIVGLERMRDRPNPNWMSIEALFAGTNAIVTFGYLAYWCVGFFGYAAPIWNHRRIHVASVVCTSAAMATCCLAMFLFGHYVVPSIRSRRPAVLDVPIATMQQWQKLGGALVQSGFACFCGFVAVVGPGTVFGQYKGTNVYGFVPNILYQIGMVTLASGIVVAVATGYRYRYSERGGYRFLDIGLVLVTLVAIGLHGDRGTVLFLFLAVLLAYNEFIRRLRLKQVMAMALGVIITLCAIYSLRFESGRQTLSPAARINHLFINFGSSSVCNYLAVSQVPHRRNYFMGRGQARQALSIIPFGRNLLGVEDNIDNNSSKLFTLLVHGPKSSTGAGSTVFADLYLDFGFWGTAIAFACIGWMTKVIRNSAVQTTSIRNYVGYIVLCAFMAIASRYTFTSGFVRYYLYSMLYMTALAYVLKIPLLYKYEPDQDEQSDAIPHQSQSAPRFR